MITNRLIFPAVALSAIFILVSCSKEKTDEPNIKNLEAIVEKANQDYMATEVGEGDEQNAFSVPSEGLIEEYLTKEDDLTSNEAFRHNKLIRCLCSVNPGDEQIPQIRVALWAFEHRNARIIQKHREAFHQLKQRIENQRNELIRQLQNGEIDRPEFRRKMAQLRQQFHNGVQRIKELNAAAFSRSYRMLMQQLNNILDDGQWEAFTDCLRS